MPFRTRAVPISTTFATRPLGGQKPSDDVPAAFGAALRLRSHAAQEGKAARGYFHRQWKRYSTGYAPSDEAKHLRSKSAWGPACISQLSPSPCAAKVAADGSPSNADVGIMIHHLASLTALYRHFQLGSHGCRHACGRGRCGTLQRSKRGRMSGLRHNPVVVGPVSQGPSLATTGRRQPSSSSSALASFRSAVSKPSVNQL
jgi:hypothetical protein